MMGVRRLQGFVVTFGMASAVGLLCSATAAAASPAWRIDALSNTTAAPGGTLDYLVQVTNVGDAASDGGQLDLVATLPADVTAVSTANAGGGASFACSGPGGTPVADASVVTCTETDAVPARDFRTLRLTVAVEPSAFAGSVTSSFQVSGGGAASANTVDPTTIKFTSPGFGIDAFDGQVTASSAGDPFTQAAGHPFAATTEIDLNTVTSPDPPFGPLWPAEPAKDLLIDLPAGFVANPTEVSQCSAAQLENAQAGEPEPLCSPSSQVGTTLVRLNGLPGPVVLGPLPVFNMVPAPGELARFGFDVAGTAVTLDAQFRSGEDYGLTLHAVVPQALAMAGLSLTLWGVPADPSHDDERACPGQPNPWRGGFRCASPSPRRAFLRNPTSCTAPGVGLPTTLSADSWTHPGVFRSAAFVSHLPPAYPSPPSGWGEQQGLTGCESVPFDPSLTAAPASTPQAGQPVAFSFDVQLPQSDDPDVLGEADLWWAAMTLAEGARVSPVGADGFGGCSPAQIELDATTEPTCPDDSKIGSVTIATPLLAEPLTGSVYLATPNDNPFDSAVALYLVAEGPGLVVKLPWELQDDPDTGQLTAVSDDFPQLPLSNVHLELSGGSHAWVVLPDACGTFTTYALAVSWSGLAVASDSSFTVSEGADGGPCPTPPHATRHRPVAAASPSRSTPQAGVASVGRIRVRHGAVLVPLACAGGSGCAIGATLSVAERVRRGRVVGIAAGKRRLRTKVGLVGRASTDLAAGQRTTLRVGLNRLGRRLLRRFGRLRATLRVAQDGKTVTRRVRLS